MKKQEPERHLNNLIERYPALMDCEDKIHTAYRTIRDGYKNGGKLLIAGNGGSAADAQHITGELMKAFICTRCMPDELKYRILSVNEEIGQELATGLECALPAIPLTSHEGLFTAYLNDRESKNIYAQQLYGYGRVGDVFWGISTSGNSENVIRAAIIAKAMDIKVVSLTGKNGGRLAEFEDIGIHVPETETYKIQELHLPVYHCICMMLEEYFFGGEE